ncbi:hypothetical protein [Streptomyces sp. NPDC058252]|uniref:hypothetical protein n=1 Tax=Streptomyces sp. NPDC058252 TaxID=3346405 RepID=UPI0036E9DC00
MNVSSVTGGITGGLLSFRRRCTLVGSCAVFVIIFGICHAPQLVDAWNKLLRGPQERRALRAAQTADVLAYFSQTPSPVTPADPPAETPAVDPQAAAGPP